jgi:uncharacterized protein
MALSHGRADTDNARRYMTQLCKHWSHRSEVRFNEETGEIALPAGACRLRAEPDHLAIELEAADPAALPRMQEVVAEHLQRFAFREPFAVVWDEAPAG